MQRRVGQQISAKARIQYQPGVAACRLGESWDADAISIESRRGPNGNRRERSSDFDFVIVLCLASANECPLICEGDVGHAAGGCVRVRQSVGNPQVETKSPERVRVLPDTQARSVPEDERESRLTSLSANVDVGRAFGPRA